MMCKHDRLAVSRVVFPDSMEIKRVFCLNCGKTKTEIDLEQLLTAARDELAAEKAGRERAEARIAELNMVLNENAVKCIKCLSVQKAALHKSETFREQAELDSERATAKWLQAEARISTQSTQLSETSTKLQNVEGAKEQAEAQCAAMRLRFEKYVRENCKLIRHSVADGIGKPDNVEGKCGGYAQNGDEPHYICQECVAAYDPEDEYNEKIIDAGSALLAELQRYRSLSASSSALRVQAAGEQGAPFDEPVYNPDKEG